MHQLTDTYTVNTTDDSDDAEPGDGVCETASGNRQCSLRAAIEESFAHPDVSSTVLFDIPISDPGYNGTFWTIGLLSPLPDLSSGIAIEGLGSKLLTLTRLSASVFRIFHVTGTEIVTLSGLTMTNGNAGTENGGAVLKEGIGIVNLTSCVLSSNSAYRGGGVSNQDAGTTNVTDSTVIDNIANDRGGGITNQDTGVLNVTSSTITDIG